MRGFIRALLVSSAITAVFSAMTIFAVPAALAAGASPLPPEVACAQIRDAVHKVAGAERNQALALHLMADGKATPMV